MGYELDLELPVSASVASAGPDLFTGTMGASIPIEVQPGRRGIQPNLALVYRGGNGNGLVGLGWKLELGEIERQSRFGVDFTSDAYVMRLNGSYTDLVADPANPGQYWAKIEGNFVRILKQTSGGEGGQPYWEVTDKRGVLYQFGQKAVSRQDDPTNAGRIFKWALNKVKDPLSNSIEIFYVKDLGQVYLDHINYGGWRVGDAVHLEPFLGVTVYRQPVANPSTLYTTGFPVTTRSQYAAIATTGGGQLIRAYALTYGTSPQSGLPLLNQVQEFGKGAAIATNPTTGAVTVTGTSLPPTTLTYVADAHPNQFTDQGTQPASPCPAGSLIGSGDFNADGAGDLWCHHTGTGDTWVALSVGSNSVSLTWQTWLPTWCGTGVFGVADLDGNGAADLWCHQGGTTTVALSQAAQGGPQTFATPTQWLTNWCADGTPFGTADFNADGFMDLWCHDAVTGTTRVALASVVNGMAQSVTVDAGNPAWLSNWCFAGQKFGTGDFDGNGAADLWCRDDNGGSTWVALSQASAASPSHTFSGTWSQPWQGNFCGGSRYNFADFNGDRKTDIICFNGNAVVALSTGSGFPASSTWITNWCSAPFVLGTGDFNGDGKADIYCHGSGATWVGLSTGSSFPPGSTGTWWQNPVWCPTGATYSVLDSNGDGKADVWCYDPTNQGAISVALSGSVSGPADALLSLANGFGGTTTIGYRYYSPPATQGPPFTLSLVSSLTATDGNGISAVTTYTYAGGYYSVPAKEFRGFDHVSIVSPPGPAGLASEQRQTTIYFHQGDDLLTVNNPNTVNGYMRGKPYRVITADAQGTIYTDRTIIYTSGKPGMPYVFNPPQVITTTSCDGQGCGGAKVRTDTLTYDEGYAGEYGNVTTEVHAGTGTASRTITHTFSPNLSAWSVSLPYQEMTYDGTGTVVASVTYDYDYGGATACVSAGLGNASHSPTAGNVRRIQRGLAPDTLAVTWFGYDQYGNLACRFDANGNKWTVNNSSVGWTQLTAVTTPDNLSTSYVYNDCSSSCGGITGRFGQLLQITGPNGDTTSLQYDALGRPTQQAVQYDEIGSQYVTTTTYPGWGTVGQQAVQTTDPAGLVSTTYFDGFRRTTKATTTGPDAKLTAVKTQYEARGFVRTTSIPYFQVTGQETPIGTTYSYDLLGRPTTTINPDGSVVKSCEANWVRVTLDAGGHRRVTTRDAFGRVVQVQDNASVFSTCDLSGQFAYTNHTYQYDALNNLRTVTDVDGNQVVMTYNSLSRLTQLKDPDLGTWSYVYDGNGNLTQQTDARTQVLTFSYNTRNQLTKKHYSGGAANTDINYTYDQSTIDGVTTPRTKTRLSTLQDPSGTVQFVYDKTGRVIRRIHTVSGTTVRNWFTYDGLDRPTSVQYYDNALVSYTYNGPFLNCVSEGSCQPGTSATYAKFATFTAMGQPASLTLGNGIQTAYTYATDTGGGAFCQAGSFRLCTIQTTRTGFPPLQNLSYGYDIEGNVTAVGDTVGGNQTYTYDNNDRIWGATGPVFNMFHGADEEGNLTYWPVVGHYAYPPMGRARQIIPMAFAPPIKAPPLAPAAPISIPTIPTAI
jgi:YD repeat-containing protein